MLPGIRTVLDDRFYTLQRTDTAVGPRVLAIGYRDTANGTGGVADLDPYFATNERSVIETFGHGSHLHKAFLELAAGGAPRIYLVALPSGTTDNDLINNTNSVFDDAFDAAETALPDLVVPYGRGANSRDWDDWATPATPGGHEQFGFHADNPTSSTLSMAKRVADKMQVISDRSHPSMAVMGIKPFTAYEQGGVGGLTAGSMTASNVSAHAALTNLYDHNSPGNTYGQYLAVCAGELRPVGYPLEFGWSNGAGLLAGTIAQLDPWLGITGKTIMNVESIRYNLNRVQQEAIGNKGVVPVALDFTRAPQWVDGRTFSKDTSDYVRLTTQRIVFLLMRKLRMAAKPFVGMPATLENRNALETAITSGLRDMQQMGALLLSDFVVTYDPRGNKADVDVTAQPAFELRNINFRITLQL